MLEVTGLRVSYGSLAAVLGVSFKVQAGSVLTIVGPNGVGKSSTLQAIAGGLASARGRGRARVSGNVMLDGEEIAGLAPDVIVRKGLTLVPESRHIFTSLTVDENLTVARASRRDRKAAEAETRALLERFPALGQSQHRRAGLLSGGQQQQLALARALLTKPKVLLLDEPSLGLSPLLVKEAFGMVAELREEGLAVVVVEQNALRAIELADHSLLMHAGQVEPIRGGRDGQLMLAAYFGIKNVDDVVETR